MSRAPQVVTVDDRKFMVHFDPETGKPQSVDMQVVRRTGYWRQAWHRMFAKPPSAAVKRAIEAATGAPLIVRTGHPARRMLDPGSLPLVVSTSDDEARDEPPLAKSTRYDE